MGKNMIGLRGGRAGVSLEPLTLGVEGEWFCVIVREEGKILTYWHFILLSLQLDEELKRDFTSINGLKKSRNHSLEE